MGTSMPKPQTISKFFGVNPSPGPVSVRLAEGDEARLRAIRGQLAAMDLPSEKGTVLRVAIREGLEVLQRRLGVKEASR